MKEVIINKQLKILIELLYNKSFKISDAPIFKLDSEKMSKVYINCKPVTYSYEGMNLIGDIIRNKIRKLNIDSVGGISTGSIPISMSIAFSSSKPINVFVIRNTEKDHEIDCKIDGPIEDMKNVVIVEDVITTGGSTIKAIVTVLNNGLNVVKVLSLVDREEGGVDNIKKMYNIEVESLVKLSDLTNFHIENLRSKPIL